MGESPRSHTDEKKLNTKAGLPYDPTDTKNKNRQNHHTVLEGRAVDSSGGGGCNVWEERVQGNLPGGENS